MASPVEICNLALVPLGVDRISSLTENSEIAKKCSALYSFLRDEEMSNHAWAFATKRIELADTGLTPEFEFSYTYQIPTDCLRILNLDTFSYSYRIEGDKLLTDYSAPYIRYIYRVEDSTLFSQQFISLLVSRLKYELALTLTGSKTVLQNLYAVYERQRTLAKAIDSQSSGTPYSLTSTTLITQRAGN